MYACVCVCIGVTRVAELRRKEMCVFKSNKGVKGEKGAKEVTSERKLPLT